MVLQVQAPGAPTGVTLTAPQSPAGALTASWTAPAGTVTGYEVALSKDAPPCKLTRVAETTAVTLTFNDLPAGAYTVAVRAVNGAAVGASASAAATVGSGVSGCDHTIVPHDWPLIPADAGPGDVFHLLFLSRRLHSLFPVPEGLDGERHVPRVDLGVLDAFLQGQAAEGYHSLTGHDTHVAGFSDGADYSSLFKVLGSSATVDARDHTGTRPWPGLFEGVPIYWLSGAKAADDYSDFYDGTWDEAVTGRGPIGEIWRIPNERPATGSNADGTRKTGSTIGPDAQGDYQSVARGDPLTSSGTIGPPADPAKTVSHTRIYALSAPFEVSAAAAGRSAPAPVGVEAGNWDVRPVDGKLPAGGGSLIVYWPRVFTDPEPTGYRVEWKLASTSGWTNAQSAEIPAGSFKQQLTGLSSYRARGDGPPSGVSHEITGLTNGVAYDVRVMTRYASGDAGLSTPSATVSDTPKNIDDQLRDWLYEVADYAEANGMLWLADVEAVLRASPANNGGPVKVEVTGRSQVQQAGYYGPVRLLLGWDVQRYLPVALHELHHVIHFLSRGTKPSVRTPFTQWEAIATLHLWESARACILASGVPSHELLADLSATVTLEALYGSIRTWLGYWLACANTPLKRSEPNDEEREVNKALLQRRHPDWLSEKYQGGDGSWESEDRAKIWQDILDHPSSAAGTLATATFDRSRLGMIQGFGDMFGGYCDAGLARRAAREHSEARKRRERADAELAKAAGSAERAAATAKLAEAKRHEANIEAWLHDPWKDGGCAPGTPTNLSATVTGGSLAVGWREAPRAGLGLSRYRVAVNAPAAVCGDRRRQQVVSGAGAVFENLTGGTYEVTLRVDSAGASVADGPPLTTTVEVPGPPAACRTVAEDWSLLPAGVGPGDRFRLLVLPQSDSLASGRALLVALDSGRLSALDGWIQDKVRRGHTDLRPLAPGFKVLASGPRASAREHTQTWGTTENRGVPVFWVGGDKLADDYAHFYDGTWDSHSAPRNAKGTVHWLGSNAYALTGSKNDGTADPGRDVFARGVRGGKPSVRGQGPLWWSRGTGRQTLQSVLGLSEVLEVHGLRVKLAFADAGNAYSLRAEGDEIGLSVTLSRELRAGETLRVPLSLVGRGMTGADYQLVLDPAAQAGVSLGAGGVLTFSDGGREASLKLTIVADGVAEDRESLVVSLPSKISDPPGSDTYGSLGRIVAEGTVALFVPDHRTVVPSADLDPRLRASIEVAARGVNEGETVDVWVVFNRALVVDCTLRLGLETDRPVDSGGYAGADDFVLRAAAGGGLASDGVDAETMTVEFPVVSGGAARYGLVIEATADMVDEPSRESLFLEFVEAVDDDGDPVSGVAESSGCGEAVHIPEKQSASLWTRVRDGDPTTVSLTLRPGRPGAVYETGAATGPPSGPPLATTLDFSLGRGLAWRETVTVPLTFSGAADTADYTVAVHSAAAGSPEDSDEFASYDAETGVLTITGGFGAPSHIYVDVAAVPDSAAEPDETLSIAIDAARLAIAPAGFGGVEAAADAASVSLTISDEHPPPTLSVSSQQAAVTEGAAVTFTITAGWVPEADLPVTVKMTQRGLFAEFAERPHTVVAGDVHRVVTLRRGTTTASLTVATQDDRNHESTGAVFAEIVPQPTRNPRNSRYLAHATAGRASVAVADNDPAPRQPRQTPPPTATPPPATPPPPATTPPPPPPTTTVPSFGDLDDAYEPHRGALDSLIEDRVLDRLGCGDGKLCPNEPITRWEMAVALVRVLDGDDPAPVQATRFSDVDPAVWWAAHVERLAELGVTVGCARGPLRYCPDRAVTRAQMASFLKRALDLPVAAPAGFADTVGSVHESDIDALHAAGVTAGCRTAPLRYCPLAETTRAQMASFLTRAIQHRDN